MLRNVFRVVVARPDAMTVDGNRNTFWEDETMGVFLFSAGYKPDIKITNWRHRTETILSSGDLLEDLTWKSSWIRACTWAGEIRVQGI
jgi:hypothetical protein